MLFLCWNKLTHFELKCCWHPIPVLDDTSSYSYMTRVGKASEKDKFIDYMMSTNLNKTAVNKRIVFVRKTLQIVSKMHFMREEDKYNMDFFIKVSNIYGNAYEAYILF